jgi:DNA mismatch repair protein MSH2
MQAIQSLGSKFRQLQINKAEYIFTTDELGDMVGELKKIEAEYERKSSTVVKKIVSVASSYYTVIGELSDVIGQFDVLNAFAVAAVTWRLVRPIVLDSPENPSSCLGPLVLKRCRHLLVEIRSAELGGKDYIPNDIEISSEANFQIITGPNMGGKSTYIRSVALCVLMNQIGCFIPCEAGSQLPVFNSVMCRVGASDAQIRGISTFMQEMIEAACIVNTANNRSLVIIDELGRGTSTQDGFGIAWAISKHLQRECKSYVLFATHFHEMAKLPGAVNRHVAASVSEKCLTLLYEVRNGPTSNSFGTNVAQLAGYPEEVIKSAIEKEQMMVQEFSDSNMIDVHTPNGEPMQIDV